MNAASEKESLKDSLESAGPFPEKSEKPEDRPTAWKNINSWPFPLVSFLSQYHVNSRVKG